MTDKLNIQPEPGTAQAEPEVLHRDIQAALDRIPAMVENLKAANRRMKIADDLEQRYRDGYMYKHLDFVTRDVSVAIRFKEIGDAAELLKYLVRAYNMHQNMKVWVYEDDKSLNWRFPGFRLSGHFNAPDAKCRFVQTGTKTVPVFTMTCDEAPDAELPGATLAIAAPVEEGMPF